MFNDAASVADTDHFDIDELDHHLGDAIRRAGEAPHPEREPISVPLDQQFGGDQLGFFAEHQRLQCTILLDQPFESIEIDHPASDCLYLALAVEKKCQFATADEHFLRKLQQGRQRTLRDRAISLFEAVK